MVTNAPARCRATPVRRRVALGWTCLAVLACSLHAAPVTAATDWHFNVLLDGTPIGTHRFTLSSTESRRWVLDSDAQFDVRLLGLSLYRYRHRAEEGWSNGCLSSIDARTDDNGRVTEVRGQALEGRFQLQVRQAGQTTPSADAPPGCLMSFAYWSPALAGQSRLLDPGSGRVESVVIDTIATVPADLKNQASVRGLRIGGLAQPIDVWYAGDRWIGLDTAVQGGRRLSYRLR